MALLNLDNIEGKIQGILDTMQGNASGIKPIDMFCAVETWAKGVSLSSKNFKWIGRNAQPPHHKHKGVGAFVRKEVAEFTSAIKDISNENILWLQILTKKKPLFVAILYCPPNDDIILENTLLNLQSNYDKLKMSGKVIALGDFNGRLGALTGDSIVNPRGKIIKTFCKDSGFAPVKAKQDVKWTLHHKNQGQSISDIALINPRDLHSISHYFVHQNCSLGSDHRLITFNWNIQGNEFLQSTNWNTPPLPFIKWDAHKVSQFKTSIDPMINQWFNDHDELTDESHISNAVLELCRGIHKAKVPLQRWRHNCHTDPQPFEISSKAKSLIKKRDGILALIQDSKDRMERKAIMLKITDLQKEISKEIKNGEISHYKTIWKEIVEQKHSGEIEEYWKLMKRLKQQNSKCLPGVIKANGVVISGKKDITNEFAKTYSNVYKGKDREAVQFNKLNKKNVCNPSTREKRNKIHKILQTVLKNNQVPGDEGSMMNRPISSVELDDAIKKAKNNTSPGEDLITYDDISNGGPRLREALLKCFNAMWMEGITPSNLQRGEIIPIFKDGDMSSTTNFRPITLLSCVFKLYERILEDRLRSFLVSNSMIPDIQKGAQRKTGTTEALFSILSVLDQNKGPATLALLDLSKAYDRVWREGLWAKLGVMGVEGKLLTALMSTYSSPTMHVKMGDTSSKEFSMVGGLRQGSVLSPLLFISLFSDTVSNVKSNTGLPIDTETGEAFVAGQCFVDDTVFLSAKPEEIVEMIEEFIKSAAVWGSVLNLHKTRILCNRPLSSISEWMNALKIKQDQHSTAKYLGVWISIRNSSCNVHYDNVIAKAQRTLYFLLSKGLNKNCLPFSEAVNLLGKLVIPQLTFAAEVLCPSKAVIKKVDKFIVMALSKITHIPESALPATAVWEAGMDNFSTMLMRAKLCFHYKLSQGKFPSKSRKYYTENNFLRVHINDLLTKVGLQEFSAEKIMKQSLEGSLSKYTWKTMCNKRISELKFANFNSAFANIKTDESTCKWLDQLPFDLFKTMIRCRHDTLGTMSCVCQNEPVNNVPLHLAFECKHLVNIAERLPIDMMIQENVKGGGSLSQVEKLHYFLGKTLEGVDGSINNALRVAVAKYLNRAVQLMA